MEDSAKRRERLQAMRLEAESTSLSKSLNSSSSTPSSLPSPLLPNPLLDASPAAECSPPAPRFDYYTDPMSAFSGVKRRFGPGAYFSPTAPLSRPNVRPRAHLMSSHQLHPTESPGSASYPMPSHLSPNNSWRSPVPYSTPYTVGQRTPVSGSFDSARSGGSSSDCYPPTPLSSGVSPYYGRGGNHMSNPGMRGGSPQSNSGRGKGGRFSGYSGPRQAGGGERGFFYRTASGQQDIEHYYLKSMVEDPWRGLEPIVGDITKPKNWPLGSKKAKAAESGNEVNFSQTGCLAQLLAESFEEAVGE